MTLYQLKIIIAIWLLFGLIGVILDLTDARNRKEYKTISLFKLLAMIIGHILLGLIAFNWARKEYLTAQKAEKRIPEVKKYIKYASGKLFTFSIDDRKFIAGVIHSDYLLTNDQFKRLESICMTHSLKNTLKTEKG